MVHGPTETIRAFCGEGDVTACLEKIKLVARLQSISDLTSFIPLYCNRLALMLYLEMEEKDQLSADGGFPRRTIYGVWSTGENKVGGRTCRFVCQ